MHVFVTGSTGFVGTVVVKHLLAHNHTVLGLCRTQAQASSLEALGAKTLHGTIEDFDTLAKGAAQCDAAVHLAFVHDFANFANCCAIDRGAIKAMGEALSPGKTFVVTSGMTQHPGGDEDAGPEESVEMSRLRGQSESLCLDFAKKGVKASVVRLSNCVHGNGKGGFMGPYVQIALQTGIAAYIEEGQNRWTAVDVNDAAELYRMVLEKSEAAGGIWHASGEKEGGVKVKDIAEKVGEILGLQVKSVTPEEGKEHFGWFEFGMTHDKYAPCVKTKERLGWEAKGKTALEDLPGIVEFNKKHGSYK